MNIILLHKRGHSRTLRIPRYWPLLAFVLLVVVPAAVGVGAYWLAYRVRPPAYTGVAAARLQTLLDKQTREVANLRQLGKDQFHAMTLKLADAEARLVRLDALGEQLVDSAGINKSDEFDFSSEPSVGGPESPDSVAYKQPSYLDALDKLSDTLERREQQLTILQKLIAHRHLERETFLAGRPVLHGWLSSRFGPRVDPFTGRVSFHPGMDFASKKGAKIIATGSGVVTWAGPRGGYGNMVQINHGNGISTRYGHAEKVLVKVGDIVHTGQVIALMGSTGRSTGPHVHYEVRKNGRPVNPAPYIARARK